MLGEYAHGKVVHCCKFIYDERYLVSLLTEQLMAVCQVVLSLTDASTTDGCLYHGKQLASIIFNVKSYVSLVAGNHHNNVSFASTQRFPKVLVLVKKTRKTRMSSP